jgi:membrane-bound lytic murein transglycosylase D
MVPPPLLADGKLSRAHDLYGGSDEMPVMMPLAMSDTASGALADLAPNERVDLDMEAERAAELAALDELESVPKRIESILAVTGTVTYDIPMSEDERIEWWIDYLMRGGRKWYEIWLSRSTRYVPIIKPILEEHGLPRDLIFLAMIESGFSPNAYSWAHASGPWQFVPFTGRRYGLEIGFWVDERRDFVASTHAAARYLKKLYNEFGDWYLAWAAYNAGEGRVSRAIQRSGTRDWWKLSRTRHLMRETKHYVPKLLAAAIVSKQPQRYGFEHIDYLPPIAWEVMTVTTSVDLATIARACGDTTLEEQVRGMNPSLRRGVTPPGRNWDVRVPKGLGQKCSDGLRAIPAQERMTYRYHAIARGETADSIAKKYQTTAQAILTFNNLDPKRMHLFDELVVPIPANKDSEIAVVQPPDVLKGGMAYAPDGASVIVHRVRPGDSLWKIAQRYRVSLKNLKLWNGLFKRSTLQVGQRLRIYLGKPRAT